MAYSFNGTSQYITANSAPVSVETITISAWVHKNAATFGCVCGCYASPANAVIGLFSLWLSNVTSPSSLAAYKIADSGAGDAAISSETAALNTWVSGAATFSSTSRRDAYTNGASNGYNTTNITTSTPTKSAIGGIILGNSSLVALINAKISDVAMWSVALTAGELASLAKGFKPTRIRPQSLVFYAPLLRNLQDLRQGLVLTAVNSPTVAAHPRVY